MKLKVKHGGCLGREKVLQFSFWSQTLKSVLKPSSLLASSAPSCHRGSDPLWTLLRSAITLECGCVYCCVTIFGRCMLVLLVSFVKKKCINSENCMVIPWNKAFLNNDAVTVLRFHLSSSLNPFQSLGCVLPRATPMHRRVCCPVP